MAVSNYWMSQMNLYIYLAQPMHGRGETLRQGENTRPGRRPLPQPNATNFVACRDFAATDSRRTCFWQGSANRPTLKNVLSLFSSLEPYYAQLQFFEIAW